MGKSEYGIKFAVHIITTHFGSLNAKVCECLLRKGALTFRDIVRFTDLKNSQVKNSLLVLTQHNCVQAFIQEQPGGFGEGTKRNTQYIVLFDNVLHRMRFGKFLEVVDKEFGDKEGVDNKGSRCAKILEALIEHGRLTEKQMFDRAQSKGYAIVMDDLQDDLQKLVSAHYVEHCPTPEPVLSLPTEEETNAKKRARKSSKIIEEIQTLEQRVVSEAMPIGAKRFPLITDEDPGIDEEYNDTTTVPGLKRKRDIMESADEEPVLWRVNFEEFIRHFRHKACIENVKARTDEAAAIVFSAMLDATRGEETKVKIEKSALVKLDAIYEEVTKCDAGRSMTIERVSAIVDQLSASSPPFVVEIDESYRIDFKNIIELAQNDEVESIVSKRYGRDAYVMFRYLSEQGRLLETEKISDKVFVEKKDAPKILYKLWNDDYLHMEKLVVTGARQSQFLLWKVNKHTLWENVLDEMLHASLNLSLRLAYELEQAKEVLSLPLDKRVGPLEAKFKQIKQANQLLQSSMFKLDDAVMLFHDF